EAVPNNFRVSSCNFVDRFFISTGGTIQETTQTDTKQEGLSAGIKGGPTVRQGTGIVLVSLELGYGILRVTSGRYRSS
ncbi:MAG: hypothetical protein ACRD6N_09720, partial [Pyrinomonadaceae bacterium]